MTLPHNQLGVRGDRGPPDPPRVELEMVDAGIGGEFVTLDGDGVGSFARVYRGRLRFGGVELPVAVKVQRDEALVREQSDSVAAKFAVEFGIHRQLAERDAGDGGGVVRQFAFGPADAPATLPPAILCRHARHALAPRCPTCRTPLAVDPWTPAGERVLACGPCGEAGRFQLAEPVRGRVLRATVRRDDACTGCERSDAECAASARWLTYFPAQMLTFELLEIDWDDYVLGRFGGRRLARHQAFWKKADAIRPEVGDARLARLGVVADLFAQLIGGVGTLHRAGVAHLDLKPRNVCLTADGGRLRVKVIDLGFATDPAALERLRQVQGQRHLDSDYAAPEVRVPAARHLSARLARVSGELAVVLDRLPLGGRDAFDPLVLSGDEVGGTNSENGDYRGRVRLVRYHDAAVLLVVDWVGSAPTRLTGLDIVKQSGMPADLFSLGMMLLGLVLGETDLRAARDALPQWLAVIDTGADEALGPRRLTDRLIRAGGQTPSVADLAAKLHAAYGEYTPVSHTFIGLALRLLFRTPAVAFDCYLRHRGDDAGAGLARLAADVRQVREEVAGRQARERADAEREWLGTAVRAVVEAVGRVPAGSVSPAGSPPYSAVLLQSAAWDVTPTDPASVRAATAELIEWYHGDTAKLVRHLSRQLDDRPTPTAGFDGRALYEMLLFGEPDHLRDANAPLLKSSLDRVVQFLLNGKSRIGDTRDRLEDWRRRAERMFAADARWDHCRSTLATFFAWADDRLTVPVSHSRRRSATLDLRLTDADRPPVAVEVVAATLDELEALRGELLEVRWAAVEGRWAAAVKGWDTLPDGVKAGLPRIRPAAEAAMNAIRTNVVEADDQLGRCLRRLRRAAELVRDDLLKPWDAGLASRGWLGNAVFGEKRPYTLSLDLSVPENYEKQAPSQAREALARVRSGSATVAFLVGLLDDLRDIQQAETAARQSG